RGSILECADSRVRGHGSSGDATCSRDDDGGVAASSRLSEQRRAAARCRFAGARERGPSRRAGQPPSRRAAGDIVPRWQWRPQQFRGASNSGGSAFSSSRRP
ncbi:hypothetical protein Dimus_033694, partial [Dionaea muscipula]